MRAGPGGMQLKKKLLTDETPGHVAGALASKGGPSLASTTPAIYRATLRALASDLTILAAWTGLKSRSTSSNSCGMIAS